jgi:transcriptional antiterminator NusG
MGEQDSEKAPAGAGEPQPPKPQWYAARCQIGREEGVRESLLARIRALKLEEVVTDVLIPTEKVTEIRSGRKQVRDRKMYSGYILIRMIKNDETWLAVRETPGMGDFLSTFPMNEHEVQRILMEQFQSEEDRPRVKIDFGKGDTVRVKEGAFENFEGIVEEIDDQKGRVKVGLTIFGRATSVDLEYWQVEKV